jgi:hypothetical protein
MQSPAESRGLPWARSSGLLLSECFTSIDAHGLSSCPKTDCFSLTPGRNPASRAGAALRLPPPERRPA